MERIVILYGSQTGTAQDAAENLGRRLKMRRDRVGRRLHVQVSPMDDYPVGHLVTEDAAAFVCSTTGQGEEPDNMKRFWMFMLRKDLPTNSLSRLTFAVLGLGDSSYVQFNFVAKKLFRRLIQLGAKPLLPLGLADDQHDLGVDAVLESWSVSLLNLLMPSDTVADVEPIDIAPPMYSVTSYGAEPTNTEETDFRIGIRADSVMARLAVNERVTAATHFQDVRLLKLDVSFKGGYAEGDVLMVQPQNTDENVDEFFRILQDRVNPDGLIVLKPIDADVPLPNGLQFGVCTWRQCVRHLFDIEAVPRRYFYEILRHFSPDELEREKLTEFLSVDGQRELYNYGAAMRRTCLEVVKDFLHSARAVPSDYYFELFPTIRARAFSIASSSSVHPDQVHILVAVVEYQTKLVKPRRGLCSTWLSTLRPGIDQISVWLRRGSFRFPEDPLTPVLMIGPGTGCAPFRSYIQHRALHLGHPGSHLFYGCRNKDGDFFFQEEWSRMQAGGLLNLYVAFSRDQEQKVYVQQRLLENGPIVWDLIHAKGACIMLAGSAKQMPQDVKDALLKVFSENGQLDQVAAENYMKKLERTRRFQCETWS